jgi:malonate transporter and related proteins
MLMQSVGFALSATLPVSIIILLGVILKYKAWITEEFAQIGSRLVFNLTLPALLFVNIVNTKLTSDLPLNLILIALFIMTLSFIVTHYLAYAIPRQEARGAFVQGTCRGNMAIIGLALAANAFGPQGLAVASIYLAALVIPGNVYSIVTLYLHHANTPTFHTIARSVVTNPLAIAIMAAVTCTVLNVTIPAVLMETGQHLAKMTLPLALICVGASIRWHEFRASRLLYVAIFGKILLLPLIATLLGFACGLRDTALGILFVMMAAPTAAAAYPMIRSIGGDYHLTAAIIAGSTLFSIVTSTVGLFLLHYLTWV